MLACHWLVPHACQWNEAYTHNRCVWPCTSRTTAHISTQTLLFNLTKKKLTNDTTFQDH